MAAVITSTVMTELSDSAPPSAFLSAQSNSQTCISDTLSWIQSNKLKLNTHTHTQKKKKKKNETMFADLLKGTGLVAAIVKIGVEEAILLRAV